MGRLSVLRAVCLTRSGLQSPALPHGPAQGLGGRRLQVLPGDPKTTRHKSWLQNFAPKTRETAQNSSSRLHPGKN